MECEINNLIRITSLRDVMQLNNENILIYFPHGLGDWVMFNNITPFLNNNIFMSRYGDNYSSIMEDSEKITPIYCGVNNVHSEQSDFISSNNFDTLPRSILEKCKKNKITHFFFNPFYESQSTFPYHSKGRSHLLSCHDLLSDEQKSNLNNVLKNNINIKDNSFITNILISKLYSMTSYNSLSKIIVISRYGITSVGKNWGHLYRDEKYKNEADEAREFIDLCLKKNPNTIFLTMESSLLNSSHSLKNYKKNVYSTEELFGSFDNNNNIPYAILLKSLFSITDIHIACPSGPLGLSLLFNNIKSIGLYIEHIPSWYFEPGKNELNIISNNNTIKKSNIRSFDNMNNIKYNNHYISHNNIPGDVVFNFIEDML